MSTSLPKLRTVHGKKLAEVAALINVRPQDLADWIIQDRLREWYDVENDELKVYARDALSFSSPTEQDRVLARVEAWQTRRRARAARREKSTVESGVVA